MPDREGFIYGRDLFSSAEAEKGTQKRGRPLYHGNG